MNTSEGALDFDAVIRDTDFNATILEMQRRIVGLSERVEREGAKIDGAFSKIGSAAAAYFTFDFASGFISQMAEVTGEFQKFRAVLKNTLGSGELADEAMGMISNYAASTPFQLNEVTDAFVKLANRGFKPTYSEMVKMGDLASSTGKGFDQLVEAILDAGTGEFERLKEFGINASKEGDKVTFAFKGVKTQVDFTNEAIRQYILSLGDLEGVAGANSEIAETLAGKISNLKDSWEAMLNGIGQNNNELLSGGIDVLSAMVAHYQDFIDILKVLVATYGTYKAIQLATIAIQKASLLSTQIKEWYSMGKAIGFASANQMMFNNAAKINPYVALSAAIVGLAASLYLLANRMSGAQRAAEDFKRIQEEVKVNVEEEKRELTGLISIVKDENKTREQKLEALSKLNEIMPDSIGYISEEAVKTGQATRMVEEYVNAVSKQLKVEALKSKLMDSQKRVVDIDNPTSNDKFWNWVKAGFNSDSVEDAEWSAKQDELEYQAKIRKQIADIEKESMEGQGKAAVAKKRTIAVIDSEIKKLKEDQQQLSSTSQEYQKFEQQIKSLEKERERITGSKSKQTSKADLDKYKDELEKLNAEAASQKISLMKAGYDKEKAEIDREYKDKLLDIQEKESTLLEAYNKSKGLSKGDVGYIAALPAEAQEAINKLKELAKQQKQVRELNALGLNDELNFSNTEQFEAMLEQTKTYEQKRLDIVGKSMLEIATLERAGLNENAAIRRKQMEDDLRELASANREKSKSWEHLYYNIERWGKESLLSRVKQLKEDLNITNLTAEERLAINKALSDTEQKLAEKYPTAALKLINERINAAKARLMAAKTEAEKLKAQGELETETAKRGAVLSETFSQVSNNLTSIAALVGQFNEDLGESIQMAGELANGFSQIASGNYLGGIVSIFVSLFNAQSNWKKKQVQKELDEQRKRQEESNKLIEEANKLYEYQLNLVEKIKGVGIYNQLKLTGDELNNSLKEAEQAIDKLALRDARTRYLKKEWHRSSYFSYEYGPVEKYKDYDFSELNSSMEKVLATPSYENIKKVYEEIVKIKGLIKDGTIFGDIDALNQQLENYEQLIQKAEELEAKNNEILTGSTYDSLLNSIVQAFDDGILSAEEFADSFEDLMKKALINSLKYKAIEEPLKKWYGEFASAMKEGDLSSSERESLMLSLKTITDNANKEFESLQEIAGMDILGGSSANKSLTGAIQGMSQQTAELIAGQFNAQRMALVNIEMYGREQVLHLAEIAANSRYMRNLEEILSIIKSNQNSTDYLRSKGVF